MERLLAAGIVWVVSCTVVGMGLMFVGPGVATVFACAVLGLCGAVIHIATHLLGLHLRWWNAGVIVAGVTTAALGGLMRGDFLEPQLVTILFIIFAAIGTAVFPLARSFMPKVTVSDNS